MPTNNQPGSRRPLAVIVGTIAAAALLSTTPKWEGTRYTTYRDSGGVLTYCDGATENSQWGKTYTPAQCSAQLDRDLSRHAEGVMSCVHVPLTDGQKIAFVDTAYNIGVTAFCTSDMARKANAGDMPGSCATLSEYNGYFTNQKQPNGTVKRVKIVLPGLVKRRAYARKLCEGSPV